MPWVSSCVVSAETSTLSQGGERNRHEGKELAGGQVKQGASENRREDTLEEIGQAGLSPTRRGGERRMLGQEGPLPRA